MSILIILIGFAGNNWFSFACLSVSFNNMLINMDDFLHNATLIVNSKYYTRKLNIISDYWKLFPNFVFCGLEGAQLACDGDEPP